jgi:hypothetical protein
MNFISKYLENKISEMAERILEENNYYSLILDKPIYVLQGNRIWEIVGVNDFGFVILKSDISVSFSMVTGPEMIKIYEQIKAGEYKFKNR